MPDADCPKSAAPKWDTLTVRPCGCGGGVRVEDEDGPLHADDINAILTGMLARAVGIDSVEAALTNLSGKTRAERRTMKRRHSLTVRILRDQAIRFLHDKRGLGIRAIAADLGVPRGTVSRAITADGRNRTRRDIARLRGEGYAVKSMPLDTIRGMLRGAQERAA